MKKILGVFLFIMSFSSMAQTNTLVEFNLLQSEVVYQLNKSNGSLNALIKDLPGGMCLHPMTFKSKDSSNNIFVYERYDTDRQKQYYQRFEVNLLSSHVNLFTSARNRTSIIPITQRQCSQSSCTNISVIPQCSY